MNMEMTWKLFCVLLFSGVVFSQQKDERNCSNGQPANGYPPTMKNTTKLLVDLRKLMVEHGVDGYIIPSADDHQTEYVAPWFKRREFITGFTGSVGQAVVTMDKAAVWVDGRYHTQAPTEVDCNWLIMKTGLRETVSLPQWINKELKGKILGGDPRVISIATKESWLQKSYATWKSVNENLVDKIWTNRPKATTNSIFIQPMKYSGQNFSSKLDNLRNGLEYRNTYGIVVNALDDVAWLLNLRGNDIPYNPFFYGYILVTVDNVTLYVDNRKITDEVRQYLCKSDGSDVKYCVTIKEYDYDVISRDIKDVLKNTNDSLWLTKKSNLFLAEAIPESKQYLSYSPIQLPKAMKNKVELDGMKSSNIKDGIAIMEYFVWLEKQIAEKKKVTEMSGQEKLREFKSKQEDYVSLSFATISGFGSNGAVIHYKASNHTDKEITDQSLYLLDSGAQFYQGSTDITRTIHLGTPTDYQKEMYTYVLEGAIGLARSIFPRGTYGRNIDVFAREHLWRKGLDYNHGTGHGIGSFLSIHEGPGRINAGKVAEGESALFEGMVFSDEPGYYEEGKFGIRLETAIAVAPRELKYKFPSKTFCGFDVLTWVPFERKLINLDIMEQVNLDWLNNYHKEVRDVMGPEIQNQGKTEVYKYMMEKTEPLIKPKKSTNGSPKVTSNLALVFTLCLLFSLLLSNNMVMYF